MTPFKSNIVSGDSDTVLNHPLIDIIPQFCNIRNKGGGIIPFELYEWQKDFLNSMKQKNIVNKARQIGESTLICALLYMKTVAREGINTKIVANKVDIAQVLLDTVSIIHNTIPKEIRPKCRHESRYEFFFEGINSRLSISSSAKDAGRGETIHNLLCSEVAFWENADDTMNGLLECVPKDGFIVVESTPFGVGNWFHAQCIKAQQSAIDWGYYEYPYTVLKEYDEDWKAEKIAEKGMDKFNQEYTCSFLLSRRLVFNNIDHIEIVEPKKLELINDFKAGFITDPVTGEKITRNQAENVGIDLDNVDEAFLLEIAPTSALSIWEEVVEDAQYVIGADVAEGLAKGDYSCAYVIRTDDMKVVACWHGHIAPDLFGIELMILGRYYNYALVGVEVNNHGLAVINAMKADYTNLYYRESFDETANSMGTKLGWHTNLKTKPLMINDLNRVIREHLLVINDKYFVSEAQTFSYDDKGKMNAVQGCFDDRIIALAIAVQMYMSNPYIAVRDYTTTYITK